VAMSPATTWRQLHASLMRGLQRHPTHRLRPPLRAALLLHVEDLHVAMEPAGGQGEAARQVLGATDGCEAHPPALEWLRSLLDGGGVVEGDGCSRCAGSMV
jgi:hypothetical protein